MQAACEDEDIDLSSIQALPAASSATCANHVVGVPLTNHGHGKNAPALARAGGKARHDAVPVKGPETCGFPFLDKLLDRKKDPVTAAAAARKSTLKDFNNMVLKSEKALALCQQTLGVKHEEIGVQGLPQPEDEEGDSKTDLEVVEMERRYQMLHRLSSNICSGGKADHEQDTSFVMKLVAEDPYFTEMGLVADGLQTIGQMNHLRSSWDLLSSALDAP